jgi:hypothetical protein
MKVLVKLVVAVVVIGTFGWMFLRTARDARAEPYVVDGQHLRPWTLAIDPGESSRSPMLVVRPPQELGSGLFSQVFSRMMESMKGMNGAGVPVVLREEYELSLAGRYTPEALLDAARTAGLESIDFTPECVAVRRVSAPGLTRQVYFVIFNAPAFTRFREQLAREVQGIPGSGVFDASALSPVLIVGATDSEFDSWLPIRAVPADECQAPITVN